MAKLAVSGVALVRFRPVRDQHIVAVRQSHPYIAIQMRPDASRLGESAPLLGILALFLVACTERSEQNDLAAPVGNKAAAIANLQLPANPNSAYLEWDAVPYPNLRGYRVYYGPDPDMYLQQRGQGIDVGNVTTYTISGLASGRRYFFAVTSVDYSNSESEFSEQVHKDIP